MSPPPLPREHGAWVMLLMPLWFGSVLAGARLSAAWLLPPAVVLVFLAYYAIVPWARRRLFWASLYFVVATALFAAVVIFTPTVNRNWILFVCGIAVLCGAAFTAASGARAGRLIGVELMGMLAMSLSAPMMVLAARIPADMRLAGAPALAFAYSASTLFYVRAYRSLGRGRVVAVVGCIVAHFVILGGIALLCLAGWLSPWAMAAFVPVLARTAWGLARPPRNLRAVGMREIWVALSFSLLAAVAVAAHSGPSMAQENEAEPITKAGQFTAAAAAPSPAGAPSAWPPAGT